MIPVLAILFVLAGEAAALGALLLGPLWLGLGLHALTCAALFAVPPAVRTGAWAGPLRLLAVLLPALGPFAVMAGIVALAATPLLRRRSLDAEVWRATLFPAPEEDGLDDRLRRLEENTDAQREAGRVVAFADVLRLGELPQQERVVALMAREYRPDFAPLLRAALNAPTRPLRAQAAAALTVVETRFTAEAQALRGQGGGPALARKLDELANSGLLEEGRARALRSEAACIWAERTASAPLDADAAASFGRDLLQLDEVTAARDALERAHAGGLRSPALIGWLAEARFRTGDLDGVEELIRAHQAALAPLLDANSPLAPALRLWLEGVAA